MSILGGISTADLQARLTALQMAYLDLSQGKQVVVASYAQGDGSRTVTYKTADMPALVQAILSVQRALDPTVARRAPLVPYWRGR